MCQPEAPVTLEVGTAKGVTLIGRGGRGPSRPSPPQAKQAHAEGLWHTLFSPAMDCFSPPLVQPVCLGESRREVMMLCWSHQPQMGTLSVLAQPQYQMMPRDGQVPANSLPLMEGLTKGTHMHLHQLVRVCNPSQSPTQRSHSLHHWWNSFYSSQICQIAQSGPEFKLWWIMPKNHLPTKDVSAWCFRVLREHHSAPLLAEALR